jgi:peptidoglycan/LPS O-acetylase OafA/YrhL
METTYAAINAPLMMGSRFAVMLFFVLSGFVLALPYFANKSLPYGSYLVRRFCRIYLPFAFAVVFSALLCWQLGGTGMPMFSTWLNGFWTTPPSAGVVLKHLAMTGIGDQSIALNPPIWSLIIEMRVSIIFPLLVFYARRFGWPGIVAALIVAYCCAKLQAALGETSYAVAESVAGALLFTARFVVLFLLGVIMSARREQLKALLLRVRPAIHGVVLSGLVLVWLALAYTKAPVQHRGTVDVFCGGLAMYLIMLCVTFPTLSLRLSTAPLLWLGDISYSLYLIHMPVMLAIFYTLHLYASASVMIAIVFPAMLLAGHVMHYLIEVPSMRLGRKLSTAKKAN